MFSKEMRIEGYDDELSAAIQAEERRQEEHIELIASENYTSPRVMEAQGSVLTNKYAEGYPASVTTAAANSSTRPSSWRSIAPSSCSAPTMPTCSRIPVPQANLAVYMALCQPGDTVLGMRLADGGHLTHGAKPSFSGKIYNAGAVRSEPRYRRDRLRTGRAPCPRAQAEDDRGRFLGLFAHRRLAAFP